MGIFTGKNNKKIDDRLMASGEDSDAVRYVKSVMQYCINNGIEKFRIISQDGRALADGITERALYLEVRNRLAVMTDSISPYYNKERQQGLVKISMCGKRYDVIVVIDVDKSIIDLQFMVLG